MLAAVTIQARQYAHKSQILTIIKKGGFTLLFQTKVLTLYQ